MNSWDITCYHPLYLILKRVFQNWDVNNVIDILTTIPNWRNTSCRHKTLLGKFCIQDHKHPLSSTPFQGPPPSTEHSKIFLEFTSSLWLRLPRVGSTAKLITVCPANLIAPCWQTNQASVEFHWSLKEKKQKQLTASWLEYQGVHYPVTRPTAPTCQSNCCFNICLHIVETLKGYVKIKTVCGVIDYATNAV